MIAHQNNIPGLPWSSRRPRLADPLWGQVLHWLATAALLSLLSSLTVSQSKNLTFKRYSIQSGLSEANVSTITQDKYGFIWVGTRDGLNMFDGYSFKVFRNDPDDTRSISSNTINIIREDRSGALWIGTEGGLNLFDHRTNSFTRFKHDPQNSHSLPNNGVRSIYEDQSGALWIGTAGGGLNLFDRESQTFTCYLPDPGSFSRCNVRDITENEGHPGSLWVATQGGLSLFDRRSGKFVNFFHNPKTHSSLSNDNIRTIFSDRSTALWIGTGGGGLDRFDRVSRTFRHFPHDPTRPASLSHHTVLAIHEDRTGRLWVGTGGGGLNLLDRRTSSFTRYSNAPHDPHSLSNNYVSCIYEDRSGLLWIGTDDGINILDPRQKPFIQYRRNPNSPSTLSADIINCIYEDPSGTLWVGTQGGGLNRYDRKTGSFNRYLNNPRDRNSLPDNHVKSIFEDRFGMLWIGTEAGLSHLDAQRRVFTSSINDPHVTNWIVAIYEDRSGALWIGSIGGGLYTTDRARNTFKRYQHDPQDDNSLSRNAVTSIVEDQKGSLWIGTQGSGLNLLDRQTNSFKHYRHNPLDQSSLSSDLVSFLYVSNAGTLWVGTMDAGLNCLNRSAGIFQRFRERDGLANDCIHGIVEDSQGRLWISTNNGLSRLEPQTRTIKNYDATDGLTSNEFTDRAVCATRDGIIYFGSINGLTAFHPDSLHDNDYIPPVAITELLLFNRPVIVGVPQDGFLLPQSVVTAEEVVLSHQQSVFALEFSALYFVNPQRQKYAYRLEGFDSDWILTDSKRRYATYTNLNAGPYVFHVKGTNHDGVWNEAGRSLRIIVTPPWWKTVWAYGGYGLIGLALLYSIRRLEKNRERLRHQLELKHVEAENLKEVAQMKSRFFANISHEFRTPLTLLLGPIDQVQSHVTSDQAKETLSVMRRNAERLLRLINQLLDFSKVEAGQMNLHCLKADIIPFVRGVVSSFESAARLRFISLDLSTEEVSIEVYFDRDKMEKVLSNLLSNAIKFTNVNGRIIVTVREVPSGRAVEIVVSDSGIGIAPEELPRVFDRFYQVDSSKTRAYEGTGIGLALTKELVEIHHGKIHVRSEAGKGTEFVVQLPLGRDHLKRDEILPTHTSDADSNLALETVAIPHSQSRERQDLPADQDRAIVLVVDDNPDLRDYMNVCLRETYRVIEARNGQEGIERAIEQLPDAVVSDVMMPRRDGRDLCRTLKQDQRTSHIPIILLTAKADTEDRIDGLESGADDYLTKPFEVNELRIRLRNLIQVRRTLRERFSTTRPFRPAEVALNAVDASFLKRAQEAVEAAMGNEHFSVQDLADTMHLSRSQLHRKLTALINLGPAEFIRYLRLHRGRELLMQQAGTVSEVAYSVGFSSPAYFAKCFREQFGHPPSGLKAASPAP